MDLSIDPKGTPRITLGSTQPLVDATSEDKEVNTEGILNGQEPGLAATDAFEVDGVNNGRPKDFQGEGPADTGEDGLVIIIRCLLVGLQEQGYCS